MKYVLARIEGDPRLKSGDHVRDFRIEFDTASALLPVLSKARELGIRGRLAIVERPSACDFTPG
jgi:hypothetical protein